MENRSLKIRFLFRDFNGLLHWIKERNNGFIEGFSGVWMLREREVEVELGGRD